MQLTNYLLACLTGHNNARDVSPRISMLELLVSTPPPALLGACRWAREKFVSSYPQLQPREQQAPAAAVPNVQPDIVALLASASNGNAAVITPTSSRGKERGR
jgi:hypothetical protein